MRSNANILIERRYKYQRLKTFRVSKYTLRGRVRRTCWKKIPKTSTTASERIVFDFESIAFRLRYTGEMQFRIDPGSLSRWFRLRRRLWASASLRRSSQFNRKRRDDLGGSQILQESEAPAKIRLFVSSAFLSRAGTVVGPAWRTRIRANSQIAERRQHPQTTIGTRTETSGLASSIDS